MSQTSGAGLAYVDLLGVSSSQRQATKQKSKFTLKHALAVGLVLGMLYTAGAAYVAHRMAANGGCTASEFAGQS